MLKSEAQLSGDAVSRQGRRYRSLKTGRIWFNLGRSSLDVVITDYSDEGARVRMSIPMPCPARFELEVLNPGPGMFAAKKCELRWQRGTTVGVLFV